MEGSLWFNTRLQRDEVQSGTRLQSLICGSGDGAEVTFASPGWAGGSGTLPVSSPMSARRSRCVHLCYCTGGSSSSILPPYLPLPRLTSPPRPLPPSHTNGVFAWLVNRADCSHLTAFRFKYLSVRWWAKSALTVRLLFKVADRRLGERGRKKASIPRCWNGIHFHVFIFCHGSFFSSLSLSIAASVRLPLLPLLQTMY